MCGQVAETVGTDIVRLLAPATNPFSEHLTIFDLSCKGLNRNVHDRES
jgi:hypothetical protein